MRSLVGLSRCGSFAALLGLLSAACQLAPTHVRPPLPTPAGYPAQYGPTGDKPAAQIGWGDFFADPRLRVLLSTALLHNRDLQVAVAQIDEAGGLYMIENSDRLPSLDLTGTATRTRARVGGEAGGAAPITFNRFAVGVGVSSFELDFWGRVRNLSEAARSQYLATVHAQRAFQLSLVRQVAVTYLAVIEADERLELASATVRSRREALAIAQVRLDSGVTSALDFRQAQSLLTQAETELAGLELTRAQRSHTLAMLVGQAPAGTLPSPLPLQRQSHGPRVAANLPSSLLESRPDVLAAEERLRAARANIGAARAAYFPSISLTGSLGFASPQLSDLFTSGGLTWTAGPALNLPIFNFGRLSGNVRAAKARERIALASYERTVQNAFREVADALAGRLYLKQQLEAQQQSRDAQRAIAELARDRYAEGTVRYIEVLDAERNLFAAEQAVIQLRRAEMENHVALYVTLGGGLTR